MSENPSRSSSTDVSNHAGDSGFGDGSDGQPKLAPLPPHAYSKQPHSDPLSFPEETTDSGGDPPTEAEMHPVQSVVVQGGLDSSFHGESSLFAFTDALGEEWKFTGIHDLGSRRKEFWETPEVYSSATRGSG